MGAIMGHVGTGFPFYIIANAGVSQWLVDLSGAASIALALFVTGVCAHVIAQTPVLPLRPPSAS
jgi:hypothetical protein